MTHAQRVFTALSHQEPDRVPWLLGLTIHGAKELGLGIREYFQKPVHVVEAQLRMQKKYGHDALYAFFHAALEYEAWGGEVVYFEDGPPNSGEPLLSASAPISSLMPPEMKDCPGLWNVLTAIEGMRAKVGDEVPVLGGVISPFSLPIMQFGFERYLDLLLNDRSEFWMLMEKNIPFCQAWANAQLSAGATAIAYSDPLASPTMIPRELFLETGLLVAQRTLAAIQGPTAISLASGSTLGVIDDLAATGAVAIGASCREDLARVKERCRGRLGVIGNLNAIGMIHWTSDDAMRQAKEAIAKGGRGGGFILSDNHGEIPWAVGDEVLFSLSETMQTWGRYPLNWVETDV